MYRRRRNIPQPPKDRRRIFLTAFAFFGVMLVWRLYHLQVVDRENLVKRSLPHYYHVTYQEADRGLILDRQGRELAINIEAYTVRARPELINDPEKYARQITDLLYRKSRGGASLPSEKTLRVRLSSRSPLVTVVSKIDPETAEAVSSLNLTGIDLIRDPVRTYPNGSMGGQFIGYVGRFNQGLAGIEFQYDSYLRGQRKPLVNRLDLPVEERSWFNISEGALRGNTVRLTIDRFLQFQAEKVLAETCRRWKAKAGVAVFIDPFSGHLLAAASYPSMDPNGQIPPPEETGRNRIVNDAFEPGSIVKPFLISEALMDGVVDPNEVFPGHNGVFYADQRKISDIHAMEVMNLEDILVHSSNIGITQIGLKMGEDKVYKAYRRFGFGRSTNLVPGEYAGILRTPNQWSGTSLISLTMGQEVSVTPLQLVTAAASLVNGGWLLTPRIVKDILAPNGGTIKEFPAQRQTKVVDPETASWVVTMMAKSVQNGTGQKASSPFYSVAGKTGTAQIFDPVEGKYSEDRFVSSFLGIAPVSHPRIVGLISIMEAQEGYYGGEVAAPVFRGFIDEAFPYLGVEPDLAPRMVAEKNRPRQVMSSPSLPLTDSGMPSLIGMTKRAALGQLAEEGVKIKTVGYGFVTKQSPLPGTPLKSGTEITLVCSPERTS